ncbi:MAG: DNA mismatch repair endonuclease MutL [Kiritimatiellae bacterium]|nr:DNA mismatch repair endonuclease MutL [Kiritimatiellia bacterium]
MLKDGHIRLLSAHVANKIAAGEVVERPASVVKELAENAIDAGAGRIDITVTAGGRKLIAVTDNGGGMGRDDAMLSIERQATSKLRDVDDIERIATLGFRGEALPSIASVSRFMLKTRRPADESGTELTVLGGSLQDVRETGVPPGTTVEVRDLFFNVPARRKFLRAYQTEQAHIRAVFTLQALAHPEIGMSLTADGRELYRLPSGASLEERVRDLFGEDFRADLRPVDRCCGEIHVSGFAGMPNVTRNERGEQYVFINRRPATAPVIAYALREAYPPLDKDRRPVVLLFIDLPPDQVDVNVHPAKREVRFRKVADVREAIIAAIGTAIGYRRPAAAASGISAAALSAPSALSGTHGAAPVSLRSLVPEAAARAAPGRDADVSPTPFPYPGATELSNTMPDAAVTLPPPQAASVPTGAGLPLMSVPDSGAPWRWFRLLGQTGGRYLLLETDEGYVTLDPRAAHERVLYERLIERDAKSGVTSQRLLLPETVQLAPADAARLRKHLKTVQDMGFAVEEFGSDHFIVEALPELLGQVSCRELLENIAHDLESAGTRRGSEKWRAEIVAKAASRAAAGAADKLTPEQAEHLVSKLALTRMPYTCPRGRPTMIFTSYRELERKFGR